MDLTDDYKFARVEQVRKNANDAGLKMATHIFTDNLIRTNYIKNFTWLGRPILQYPSDLMVMQELIWHIQPDNIIETGIAFGGSTVFFASMLEMIGKDGYVFAVDKEIRARNRAELNRHQMMKRIWLFEGDSTDQKIVDDISKLHHYGRSGFVVLDSNHTEAHVLAELRLYQKFVSVGSYMVVCDTTVEDWDDKYHNPDRPWGKGNNPMTAVMKFLEENHDFEIDHWAETAALVTACRNGYLRRVK